MTYSTYDRPMEELPGADEAHSIPSALWKVIDSGDRVQAWLFENDRSAAGGEIPLEVLEQRTGWDFPQNGYQD
ncbi:MAG: hypothetical protein ACO4AI_05470 [Prochlorothrix sp.]